MKTEPNSIRFHQNLHSCFPHLQGLTHIYIHKNKNRKATEPIFKGKKVKKKVCLDYSGHFPASPIVAFNDKNKATC